MFISLSNDNDCGICDDSYTYSMGEDDADQHYSKKRASLILGRFLLMELIVI